MSDHDDGTAPSALLMSTPLEREARDWLVRLHSGKATRADFAACQRWCARSREHARAYEEAGRLWSALHVAAERVADKLPPEELAPPRPAGHAGAAVITRRGLLGGALAAGAVGLIYRPPLPLWPSFQALTADYRTAKGERKQVHLEEGLVVDINTATTLNRLSSTHGNEGLELLSGEASFRNQRSSPLTVVASHGELRSQEAVFNVRNTGPRVCVTCEEGKVALHHRKGSYDLRQGQQALYDQRSVEIHEKVDMEQASAWREGWVVFRDAPLSEVVEEINRYRDGHILIRDDSLARRRLQGRFAIQQLAEIPEMIRDSYGASLTRLPGGIVILG